MQPEELLCDIRSLWQTYISSYSEDNLLLKIVHVPSEHLKSHRYETIFKNFINYLIISVVKEHNLNQIKFKYV